MNPHTMLYRIVHPAQVQGEAFTSQVFRPNPTGTALVPVFDGDQVSPEEVLRTIVSSLSADLGSYGIIGVTVAECRELGLGVKRDEPSALGRAAIDFAGYSSNQIRRQSRALREFAMSRGWFVRPKG